MAVHVEPRSTLPLLRGLLEVSRLLRDEPDLATLFDAIAAAIGKTLGFRTVVVRVYRRAWDDFEVVTVHGGEEVRHALLGSRRSLESLRPYLDERFDRGGAYMVRHEEADWSDPLAHVPDIALPEDSDGWHPEDALMVPLKGSGGELLGTISLDEPDSGKRPTDEELDVLVTLVHHVAAAIESAQSAFLAQRHREALARLLELSSQLAAAESVDGVLATVARGISSALGFEKVVVAIADASGRFVPRGVAGFEPGDPGLDFHLTQADIQALLDPQLDLEGCILMTHTEAESRIGPRSSHRSERNGHGSLAWYRHWLIVPLVERDGSILGFVWADDPEDHLLPSRERLQALRTFANHATVALRAAMNVETLNMRNTELAALHDTTLSLLEGIEPEAVLHAIADSARQLVDSPNAYIYLAEGPGGDLRMRVGLGAFEPHIGHSLLPGTGASGVAYVSGETVVLDDYESWSDRLHVYEELMFHAVVGIPLRAGGEVVGVIGVARQDERAFTRSEVALLERFAQLASLALENARLYESLQREIVERDRLHEQLRQAQKMEAVGRLAGGIAHDFNNLLTAIGGYAELGLADLRAGDADAAADGIAQISRASGRAAELTAQLLAFSRKQVLDPHELDVNEVVSDMASMLARMLGEDVVLSADLDTGLGTVLADAGQLEQVVLNLAINARDAMPTGGELSIRTRNLDLPSGETSPAPGLRPGHYVLLEVEDTGVGMVQTLTERIFEPFFTTKEVGAGTGLGLATVHGIVTQSGGAVWVESTPGEGTCFSICLPRVV